MISTILNRSQRWWEFYNTLSICQYCVGSIVGWLSRWLWRGTPRRTSPKSSSLKRVTVWRTSDHCDPRQRCRRPVFNRSLVWPMIIARDADARRTRSCSSWTATVLAPVSNGSRSSSGRQRRHERDVSESHWLFILLSLLWVLSDC